MPKITPGQEFDTLADFKAYLRTWAVEDNFSPAILDSDARRVRVGCRTAPNCPFRIRCNFDQDLNKARVSTLVTKHTCQDDETVDNANVVRGEVTKLRFLLDAVPQLMIVDRATRTQDIIQNIKNRYGTTISLRQAQKVKSTLIAIASESLGQDLYNRMKQKLGEDATEEEMRRGRRLRDGEDMIDPRLYDDDVNDEDYQDDEMADYQDDDDYDDVDDGYMDEYVPETRHDTLPKMQPCIDPQLQDPPLDEEPTAAEMRAQAAQLFQQASKKFQEATQLHMQASRLFSQATARENQQLER